MNDIKAAITASIIIVVVLAIALVLVRSFDYLGQLFSTTTQPTVKHKQEVCDKHAAVDVNNTEYIILMCPSQNYIINPKLGSP